MAPGKVVVITGSSRGIGAETAKLFAQHGYSVCINYHSNEAAAEHVKQKIIQLGGRCITVKADASQESDVKRLFQTVDAELGNVSVLVNNARNYVAAAQVFS
jgi:NAD(P)-dependent dehydrogenase (short-subunit alcohol dehydrogenase family)